MNCEECKSKNSCHTQTNKGGKTMSNMEELQNEAIAAAAEHIREQRKKSENMRLKIICLTIFACVVVISAAFLGCFAIYSQQQTIIEQQYALNMQYASLIEYLSNAEVTTTTTETVDSGGGGVAAKIEGSNNVIGGGE